MDSLFRLTDLETRVPLNLNVLDADRTPRVMGLKQVLTEWLALPDRGAGQPLEPPARQDRRPDRAARRLSDRLSEPRPGDPDHPHRGRAQAGDDRRIRAHRPPGRGDPQHAAALACASSRRCRSARSGRRSRRSRTSSTKLVESPARQRTRLKKDLAALRERYGPETDARPPPHPDRGGRAGARDPAGGDDRARADHRDPVEARLDPGDAGPCRG